MTSRPVQYLVFAVFKYMYTYTYTYIRECMARVFGF